ncbi:MAG: DNA-binding response regulator [Flavobacteriaceae bacterium]|nr:DNA-binding response regulator [Flavobacteriaceae bacterium]
MELQVLMVDDHPPIIEGYTSILAHNPFGYILNTSKAHSCEAAYNLLLEAKRSFDIVFLDMTLPPYSEKNINTGVDLVPIVRKLYPNAKIVILTSHYESIVLFKIIKEYNPEGILIKSDFHAQDLIKAFDVIVKGGTYYTETVINQQKSWGEKNKVMDSYNRQILSLLAQGVKTKNFPDMLHLSKSAIDKRKAMIKQLLGIDKGNDEDILREARKQGLI